MTHFGSCLPGSNTECGGKESPGLYESLTRKQQFPDPSPVKRGHPIEPPDRIQGDPTPVKEAIMSTAELQERPDVEIELVEQWRAQSLARVGYDLESAAVLAASHEVDLHLAMRLLESGCPVDLALQILL